jgi:hypothetical protein
MTSISFDETSVGAVNDNGIVALIVRSRGSEVA